MNRTQAMRVFIAAHDDPVLAAWVYVFHEHKMSPSSDVSPYECWEAFEAFFAHGFVSPHQFDGIDARQVFFSGRRPPAGEIQRALHNLHMLPEHQPPEPPMTSPRSKFPANPFGDSSPNALVANDRGTGLAQSSPALPPQRSTGALNPFGHNEPRGRGQEPLALDGFGKRSPALHNGNDQAGRHLARPARSHDIDLEIRCCGEVLDMQVADMQAEGPDSVPGGQISVIDRILHGTCPRCERTHHHSVGEVVAQDEYR